MTRSYFIDNITEWYQLLDFCYDEDCDLCEDLFLGDNLDSRINDDLYEAVRNWSWEDVRYSLNDISAGYDCYYYNGLLDYEELTPSDFDGYKDYVINWMDNGEYWDAEEDEEDEDDFDPDAPFDFAEEDNDDVPEEDFSVGELISACLFDMTTAIDESEKRRRELETEEENAFVALFA